jgi:hypothetical protein
MRAPTGKSRRERIGWPVLSSCPACRKHQQCHADNEAYEEGPLLAPRSNCAVRKEKRCRRHSPPDNHETRHRHCTAYALTLEDDPVKRAYRSKHHRRHGKGGTPLPRRWRYSCEASVQQQEAENGRSQPDVRRVEQRLTRAFVGPGHPRIMPAAGRSCERLNGSSGAVLAEAVLQNVPRRYSARFPR